MNKINDRKKIVINTSTIRVGGAVQVAINIIKQSFIETKFDIYYVTNTVLFKIIPTEAPKTCVVENFPSSPLAIRTKRQIKEFVNKINADLVYSVGAPSYVQFDCKEVMRLTNPWLIEKNILAIKKLSFLKQIKTSLEVGVKKIYLKNVDYFITQTEDAKNKIVINLNKESKNVHVIQNVYSYNFQPFISENYIRDYSGMKNILCVSANYFHKNIILLVEIAFLMKKQGLTNYTFLLTIPNDEWENCEIKQMIDKFKVNDYFINLGKLTLEELVFEYKKAHIFILPTLLEVFSVSFLEAMIFDLPIITTDFSFNSGVCKDAAFYLKDPFNAEEALGLIQNISNIEVMRNKKLNVGKKIISSLVSNKNVYCQHFDVLRKIMDN